MKPPRQRAVAARPPALSGKERYERFMEADVRRSKAMAPEKAVTAADVTGTILPEVDRRRGEDGAWTVEPHPVRGRDSWIFKAHTPLAPWPVAVKVYCTAVTADEIRAQRDHLRHYHEHMASRPDLTVPAVWASVPDHRTLLMEWIEAPRMDNLLRSATADERSQLFAAAGRWLRHYHAQSEPVVRPLRVRSYAHHIDMLLGGESGAGGRVRDGVFRKAYETLVGQAEAFGTCRLAYVMAHGDFVPHNVFHGGGRTVGFDTVPRPRPALSDICHFLVHAEIKKPLSVRRARLGPTGMQHQDVQAFFEAYGPLENLGDDSVATYMQLNEALLRWAVMISHLRRGGRPRREHLTSWLRYRRIAKHTAATLREGAPATGAGVT